MEDSRESHHPLFSSHSFNLVPLATKAYSSSYYPTGSLLLRDKPRRRQQLVYPRLREAAERAIQDGEGRHIILERTIASKYTMAAVPGDPCATAREEERSPATATTTTTMTTTVADAGASRSSAPGRYGNLFMETWRASPVSFHRVDGASVVRSTTPFSFLPNKNVFANQFGSSSTAVCARRVSVLVLCVFARVQG